jgi:hypothetical protein
MNTSMLGALGILLLGLSIFGFSAGDAFPGWRAMLPVLGSAALIAAQRSKINEWLATAPFQFFGNISYSLYLWHWPVLVWAKYTLGNVTPLQSAGLLGIALALSVLSWRFVEKPTRRSLSGFRVSTAYASAILIAITWSVLVHKEHGFPTRLPDYLIQAAEAATLKNPHQEACFNDPSAMSHPDGCVEGNGNTPPSIALWVDSHADQLQNVVEQLLSGDRLLVLTYGGCPPLIGHAGPGSGVDSSVNCESFANRSYQHLLASPSIKVVILAAEWRRYSTPFVKETLKDLVDGLLNAGKKVVLVGSVPDPMQDVPKTWGRDEFMQRHAIDTLTVPLRDEARVHQQSLELMAMFKGDTRVIAIDPFDRFCWGSDCFLVAHGKAYYLDPSHLNLTGAQILKQDIRQALTRLRG